MGRKRKIVRRSLLPVEVLGEVCYLDSLCMVLPERMPPEIFRPLFHSVRATVADEKERCWTERVPTANGFWIYKMYVHQPTLESMEWLEAGAKAPYRARLLEAHIALDLLTEDRLSARRLQNYVEEHFLPSGRLKTPVTYRGRGAKQTAYYNRATRKGTEIKLYSDRDSKATGSPCLHIEWRVVGKVALDAAGVRSINDLVALDYANFCDKRLSLWRSPTAAELAKVHRKSHRLKCRVDFDSARSVTAANRLVRSAQGENGAVVAHDLLIALLRAERDFSLRPKRLFTKEPHNWMLPPKNNALWPTA